MNKKKLLLLVSASIALAMLSLAFTQSGYYRKMGESQKLINQIYNQIFSTYVEELDPDIFTKASIKGITKNLDPYTEYMVEEEQHNVNVLSDGNYGGVGIQLGFRNNTMSVIAPMDGSPAKKAGILSGDIILEVNGKDIESYSFSDAAAKIRGKKGSKVGLTIKRFGVEEPILFSLIRSKIDVKTVTFSEIIAPGIGLIRLNRFSRNTPKEMYSSISSLLIDGADELIFDLRDNPGGLLSSAVSVLDMIFEKNTLLVSTKGRIKDSNRTFYARKDPVIPENIKIAVLINQGSASASEIVAGAIQDLDRGIIIGQKSFGKGLVQTAYEIDKKSMIKVTTAKYYIPSGRFIQKRDYIDEKYVLNKALEDTVFMTAGGRKVFANGGITPDTLVIQDLMKSLTTQYWRNGYFYAYAQKNKHNYPTFNDVKNDSKLVSDFLTFAKSEGEVFLPGEKELNLVVKNIYNIDSTNTKINEAINILKDFYVDRENIDALSEINDMKKILLLEFSGLIDGPDLRLKLSFNNDKIVSTALSILSTEETYYSSLGIDKIIEN